MKISKIIFLSLVGVIALMIIAGALDIRINGKKGPVQISGSVNSKKITLPSFKVLSMNGTKNVAIVKGDSNYIEIDYQKDFVYPDINFQVRNDTLIIKDLNLSSWRMMGKIYVAEEPNRFLLKNSNLILNDNFVQSTSKNLYIDLDNSNINIYQNDKSRSSFSYMDIKERNKSRIFGNGIRLDSLKVDIQDSRTELHSNVQKVKGVISDKGYLHLDSANEIEVKKDSGSEVRIF
jgi:hypothetical protein